MAETKATAAPRRPRSGAAATTKTAAKPTQKPATAPKAKPPAEETPATPETVKVQVNLVYTGDTKKYAKFEPPADSGCVGTFYAPLGTDEVKVLLILPPEAVAE